jgi:hypothetical protein
MRIGGAWSILITANAIAPDLTDVVLLGQVAARLSVLELACNRCNRLTRSLALLRSLPAILSSWQGEASIKQGGQSCSGSFCFLPAW